MLVGWLVGWWGYLIVVHTNNYVHKSTVVSGAASKTVSASATTPAAEVHIAPGVHL